MIRERNVCRLSQSSRRAVEVRAKYPRRLRGQVETVHLSSGRKWFLTVKYRDYDAAKAHGLIAQERWKPCRKREVPL